MSAIERTDTGRRDEERTGPLSGGALRAAARTHRGAVRPDNQDAFVCRPDLGLFAVIDGMGGQQAGRRAAELAREALIAEGDPARGLVAASERICAAADTRPELHGMGSTCVAILIHPSSDGAFDRHAWAFTDGSEALACCQPLEDFAGDFVRWPNAGFG